MDEQELRMKAHVTEEAMGRLKSASDAIREALASMDKPCLFSERLCDLVEDLDEVRAAWQADLHEAFYDHFTGNG